MYLAEGKEFYKGIHFIPGLKLFTAYGVADQDAELRGFLKDNVNIHEDDAWFICGEIDVRWYIPSKSRDNGNTIQQEIDIVLARYLGYLQKLNADWPILAVTSIIPPPVNVAPHLEDIGVNLSLETRVSLTKEFNRRLGLAAIKAGIRYLDIYSLLSREDGAHKPELVSADGLHYNFIGDKVVDRFNLGAGYGF